MKTTRNYCIIYLGKKPDSFCGAKILADDILNSPDNTVKLVGFSKRDLLEKDAKILIEILLSGSEVSTFDKIIFIDVVPSNDLLKSCVAISNSVDLFINTILDSAIYDKNLFLKSNINIFETERPKINSVTKLIFKHIFDTKIETPAIIELIDKAVKSKESNVYQFYTTITEKMFDEEYQKDLSGDVTKDVNFFEISAILNTKLLATTQKIIKNSCIIKMDDYSIGMFNCPNDYNQLVTKELRTTKTLTHGIACLYSVYNDKSVGLHFKLVDTDIVSESEFNEFCNKFKIKGYNYAGSKNITMMELAELFK